MAPSERAGVLPVDKPVGPTSHDVVAAARRALRERRIGHTGTLDPFASGLLLLCVGAATRIAQYLSGLPKTYAAVIRFGAATDTDDRTGAVIERSDAWSGLTPDRIADGLRALTGTIEQVPPAYSAKKVGGVAVHRLARAGRPADLAPVPVTIHSLRVERIDLPDLALEVQCSAGTYVRAIARDLGAALGVPAHLAALRRTRIGPHAIASALPAASLGDAEAVDRAWLTPLQALAHMPHLELDAAQAAVIAHGGAVAAGSGSALEGTVALCREGQLVAIADAGSGWLRPRQVLAHA
jgi:tRNA pseudouridine55 synthase